MADVMSRVSVVSTEVLAKGWSTNTRVVIDYTRADGTVQRLKREIHDHGDGATILLYSRARGTVVLVRQFRLPPYLNGDDPFLIETCAGLLDADHPEDAIRREAEEKPATASARSSGCGPPTRRPAPSPSGCTTSSPNTTRACGWQPAAVCTRRARRSRCWSCR